MSFNTRNIKNVRDGFELKCLFILIKSYRNMKSENNYNCSWKENKITKTLVNYVKNNEWARKWHFEIVREYYLDEYQPDNKDPDETPRIDIRFSQWERESHFFYFIEAKNLCANDWIKEDGKTIVKSAYQIGRYINKGVSHFSSGYYPINGCLCGYILKGEPDLVINILNNYLAKESFNKLERALPISEYSLIYKIKFKNSELINIFFEFK